MFENIFGSKQIYLGLIFFELFGVELQFFSSGACGYEKIARTRGCPHSPQLGLTFELRQE